MEGYEIICYHSTKVLNTNCIMNNGLQPNEWNWYKQSLIKTFMELGINEDHLKRAMDLIKHEYDRKYINREPALCFYSDLSLIGDGETAGYEQFCENIGGELARWSLKKKEPDIYKLLKENGEQVIVKFKLPFSDIVWHEKDTIVYQFVSHVAGKHFWNYKYQIQFDGITRKAVPSDNILELIPYEKEIDY